MAIRYQIIPAASAGSFIDVHPERTRPWRGNRIAQNHGLAVPLPEGLESPPNAESAEKQSQGLQQLQHEFILLPDDQQDGETDTHR